MSLLITGNKSKINSSEIKSVNIWQISGLVDSFETYLDPLQQSNIANLNNSIVTINNDITNLTNLLNNNNLLDTTQNTQITTINENINIINNQIIDLQNNKSDLLYVQSQLNNINNSIVLINNDINDILTKNITFDNFIYSATNEIENINTWLNDKLNLNVYNTDLTNLYNKQDNQQTQINNINWTLSNLGGQDLATNAQIETINTQINYLNPIVNTSQTKINTLENQTIPNINNSINLKWNITDVNNWLNTKLNITDFNTEKTNINNSINLKWNITDVNNWLNTKLNITDFNTEKTTLNNSIALKSNITDLNNGLALKLNITDFNTEKTTLNNSINLKWNITDVYYKPVLYTKTETDTLLNNKANQLTTYTKTENDTMINNINTVLNSNDENNVLYVDFILGNDNNNGRNIKWKLKTIEKAFDIATGWTTIKILGSNTYNINYTLSAIKTSIKIIINEGALINGTLNLVQGNTAIQFYGGKMTFTLNDNSAGTTYFKNCDLDSSTFNFTNGGYKTIENSTFNLTLINLSNTSTKSTLNIKNVGLITSINVGNNWSVLKTNTALNILWLSASGLILDTNNYVCNSVITSQAILNIILSSGTDGSYIVNFASPTGIPNLKKGDIFYKSSWFFLILNNFIDAPASVSVYNSGTYDTYIKNNGFWVKYIDSYSKTESDTNLNNVINNFNTWINLKSNIWDVYNKTEITNYLNLKSDVLNTYNKNEIDNYLLNKLNIWIYNNDKWNIDNYLNNLNILKCDLWFFNNEIVLYTPKTFLTNNYYNKSWIDDKLLLKSNITYVDNEILNLSNSLGSILIDIFNINNSINDLNNFKNVWYETTTNLTDSKIVNLENLTNNLSTNITNLENYNIWNTTNINNINSNITTLQTYNNTNGNINLWRININNASENKILKIVGGVLDWANDNAGTAVDLTTINNKITALETFNTTSNNIALSRLINLTLENMTSINSPATHKIKFPSTWSTKVFEITDPSGTWAGMEFTISALGVSKNFKMRYYPSFNEGYLVLSDTTFITINSSTRVVTISGPLNAYHQYTLSPGNPWRLINLSNVKEAAFATHITDYTIPITKLVKGTEANQVLTYNGTNIVWQAIPTTDLTNYYIKWEIDTSLNLKLNISDFSNISISKLWNTGALINQVLTFDGTNIIWQSPSGGSSTIADNSILLTKLQTEIIDTSITWNPWLEFLFYNYYSNKFIKAGEISNNANFQIIFNTSSQSALQYTPNGSGSTKTFNFGNFIFDRIYPSWGGIGLISDRTGILLNRLNPVLIIWDQSVICNFYYSSSSTIFSSSLKAQISNTGTYTVMSSELRKNNIEIKKNNNVLNRLLNLKIYSYILNDVPDKVVIGLVINEHLYTNFRNIIINNTPRDKTSNIKEYKDLWDNEKYNLWVDYSVLLCYLIMAFQEFKNFFDEKYTQQHNFNEKIIQSLKDTDDNILNLVKMKKSESYSNLLNNSYDSAISDLIKNNELLNKKNEILKNQLNTLEIKYNSMENQYNNMAKSYDELFIEIKHLKDSLNNKQDIQKTSSLFKKSTTLKK